MRDRLVWRITFEALTPKQLEVMELVADNRTTKEIGHKLEISDSAVNQRVNALRTKFGNVPRSELARIFRQFHKAEADETCQQMTGDSLQLPSELAAAQSPLWDETSDVFSLADAVQIRIDTPWESSSDPRVVPGVLDGNNALLARGTLILVTTAAILVSLVAVVGLGQGMTLLIRRLLMPS